MQKTFMQRSQDPNKYFLVTLIVVQVYIKYNINGVRIPNDWLRQQCTDKISKEKLI